MFLDFTLKLPETHLDDATGMLAFKAGGVIKSCAFQVYPEHDLKQVEFLISCAKEGLGGFQQLAGALPEVP